MSLNRALHELAWRGYDPRAALPHLGLAALASAALLGGRWYFDDLTGLIEWAGVLAVYALALAVWPGLLALIAYRTVTYTYRLTDRALVLDRGPLFRPVPPIWLVEVAIVEEGSSWLGVGRVRIGTKAGRIVNLKGVRDPGGFVAQIREAIEKGNAAATPE